MKKILLLSSLLFSANSFSEIAIIVNKSNTAEISTSELSRIYLGKLKRYSNGERAIPINQTEKRTPREEFNKKALKKSPAQIKAYWSKLIFTGKGSMPQEVESDAEVLKLIKNNSNLIGYIDAASVTDDVRVITTL